MGNKLASRQDLKTGSRKHSKNILLQNLITFHALFHLKSFSRTTLCKFSNQNFCISYSYNIFITSMFFSITDRRKTCHIFLIFLNERMSSSKSSLRSISFFFLFSSPPSPLPSSPSPPSSGFLPSMALHQDLGIWYSKEMWDRPPSGQSSVLTTETHCEIYCSSPHGC